MKNSFISKYMTPLGAASEPIPDIWDSIQFGNAVVEASKVRFRPSVYAYNTIVVDISSLEVNDRVKITTTTTSTAYSAAVSITNERSTLPADEAAVDALGSELSINGTYIASLPHPEDYVYIYTKIDASMNTMCFMSNATQTEDIVSVENIGPA